MINRWILGSALVLGLIAAGCGDDSSATVGGGGSGGSGGGGGSDFEPSEYGAWVKYEPEGATCSNGSQYKFWVQFSETSDNVIVFFEGGGACWDYESCTGGDFRGAANPNGLDDDHAIANQDFDGLNVDAKFVYPLLNDDPAISPMSDWNKVFVPYCTGDVYSGQATITYSDPDGIEPDNEFIHSGHPNILAMIDELNGMFSSIPQLFVSGCSAGGAGAIINYHFLRSGLNDVSRGYLLDDSGPLYPNTKATSRSLPLHNRVRSSWNVDPLIMSAPNSSAILDDFGNLSTVLASEYPNDRLATTFFRLDYNYSLYSYERFYDNDEGLLMPIDFGSAPGLDSDNWVDRADIYSLWWDDTDLLRGQYDAVDNLGYYLPFYRDTNDSHCVTIPGFADASTAELLDAVSYLSSNGEMGSAEAVAWAGSDMNVGEEVMNLRDYVDHLLDDDTPLQSFFEDDGEGQYVDCTPGSYDEEACMTAVCERLSPGRRTEQGCPAE